MLEKKTCSPGYIQLPLLQEYDCLQWTEKYCIAGNLELFIHKDLDIICWDWSTDTPKMERLQVAPWAVKFVGHIYNGVVVKYFLNV